MKKQVLLFVTVCIATLSSFAQFSFVHISDMHVSTTPSANSDTNEQYFQCAIKEFANLNGRNAGLSIKDRFSRNGNRIHDKKISINIGSGNKNNFSYI